MGAIANVLTPALPRAILEPIESGYFGAATHRVVITTEDMAPAYEIGDEVFVDLNASVRDDREAILLNRDGDFLLRNLVSRTGSRWTVQQYNPARTYYLSRTEWPRSNRVVGVVLGARRGAARRERARRGLIDRLQPTFSNTGSGLPIGNLAAAAVADHR
jgi:hypothetical protein